MKKTIVIRSMLGALIGVSLTQSILNLSKWSILVFVVSLLALAISYMISIRRKADGSLQVEVKVPNPSYYLTPLKSKRGLEKRLTSMVSEVREEKPVDFLANLFVNGRIVEAVSGAVVNACLDPKPSLCQALERERTALMDEVEKSEKIYSVFNFSNFGVTHEEMHEVAQTIASGIHQKADQIMVNKTIIADIKLHNVVMEAGMRLAHRLQTVDDLLVEEYFQAASELVFSVEENEGIKDFPTEDVSKGAQLAMYISTIITDMNSGELDWKKVLPFLDRMDSFINEEVSNA